MKKTEKQWGGGSKRVCQFRATYLYWSVNFIKFQKVSANFFSVPRPTLPSVLIREEKRPSFRGGGLLYKDFFEISQSPPPPGTIPQ